MSSNTFLYKPVSESNGNLVVLTPNAYNGRIAQVQIVDPSGNVVSTGRFAGDSHNGARGHFRFDRPGRSYAGGQVRITFDDGSETQNINIGGGGRFEQGMKGDTLSGGGGGGSTSTSPGGNTFVNPSFANFGGLQASNVDFQANIDRARSEGAVNNQLFFENLSKSKQPALDLVDTDIEGIQKGLDAFIPRIREEGDIDQQTNIDRAGAIDQANFDRLPGFNEFNRGETDKANIAAQEQRDRAVDASGLGYRQRMGDLVERLDTRSRTGSLGGELDDALSTELANRGSDLGRASGISTISGAGVRASDRLTVAERVDLALGAESALPNVLAQGQSILSAPEERTPTLYGQPTNIPLSQANIADRIPITSSISAGAAQQGLASEVNQYQLLPATGILSAGIGVDTFNEQSRYARDQTVLQAEQAQLTATDNAMQGALNADKGDMLRNQQFDAFQSGNRVLQRAQAAQAAGTGAGIVSGRSATTGLGSGGGSVGAPGRQGAPGATGQSGTQGSIVSTQPGGGMVSTRPAYGTTRGGTYTQQQGGGGVTSSPRGSNTISSIANGIATIGNAVQDIRTAAPEINSFISGASDTIIRNVDAAFGDGDGSVTVGNVSVEQGDYDNFTDDVANMFTGSETTPSTDSQPPTYIGGEPVSTTVTNDDDSITYKTASGNTKTVAKESTYSKFFNTVTQPFVDAGIDLQTVTHTADVMTNWENMSDTQRIQASSNITTDILENRGIIDRETAREITNASNAISVMSNPHATDSQRVTAVASAGAAFTQDSFTGTVEQPTTIGGNAVVGSTTTPDGQAGFQVVDSMGNTSVVSQQSLVNSANTASAIQTFAVLTSDADSEDKVAALTGIGVNTAEANGLISEVSSGNVGAALSIFNLASNFNEMNSFQQAVAIVQTGRSVMQATAQYTIMGGATQVGAQVGTQVGSQVATNALGTGATQVGSQVATNALGTGATQVGTSAATNTTGSVVGAALGGAAIVAGGVMGVMQAADTLSAINDMPQSSAVGAGATGLAAAGMGIGAAVAVGGAIAGGAATGATIGSSVPIVGTIIGAAVGALAGVVIGSTGSGKGSGQMMRDGWRSGLEASGVATKNEEGNHELTLADGTKYNIGADGTNKLPNVGTNVDGKTERNTFDVDWSNPVATQSIPEAHLFAIATGLDPTSHEEFGLFQRAVAQSLNGATSNATSVEGVRENFKAIMTNAGIDPRHVAMRLESLRVSNKITEDEYGVYLDRVNQIFDTQLTPSNRDEVTEHFISKLGEDANLEGSNKELYENITSQEKLLESQAALDKRIEKERATLTKKKTEKG